MSDTASAILRRRSAAGLLIAAALAVALAGGCTARELEDLFYAGGKIAYDSMKARQDGK